MDHSMELLANRDIPNYNTRNRDMLRLALATKNLGKQRVCYHPLKDWNNLDKATTNAPDIEIKQLRNREDRLREGENSQGNSQSVPELKKVN